MINREEAKAVFDAYTAEYDLQNPMIYHKAVHTMKVAEMAEEIAKSIRPDEESVNFPGDRSDAAGKASWNEQ